MNTIKKLFAASTLATFCLATAQEASAREAAICTAIASNSYGQSSHLNAFMITFDVDRAGTASNLKFEGDYPTELRIAEEFCRKTSPYQSACKAIFIGGQLSIEISKTLIVARQNFFAGFVDKDNQRSTLKSFGRCDMGTYTGPR